MELPSYGPAKVMRAARSIKPDLRNIQNKLWIGISKICCSIYLVFLFLLLLVVVVDYSFGVVNDKRKMLMLDELSAMLC